MRQGKISQRFRTNTSWISLENNEEIRLHNPFLVEALKSQKNYPTPL